MPKFGPTQIKSIKNIPSNTFHFSGKSLLLKERAIISKKAGHRVLFISLGSSDCYGAPYKHPIIYDILTHLEFSQIEINFLNTIDLLEDYQKRYQKINNIVQEHSSSPKGDNLECVFKIMEKSRITFLERDEILKNHKIDPQNAAEYYNATRKEGYSKQKDVYELLMSYIEQHPEYSYYIDEMPILLSKTSKLLLNHGYLTSI